MMLIMMLSLLTLMILSAMLMLINFLSKKTFSDKEKNSPFECGFEPVNVSRMPFSIQFFLIAIIFLIFDVEIALILPFIKICKYSELGPTSMSLMSIILILIIGVYHEWNQGALKWLK
uniref:NADH-ubiquinone oxidoreductase chain 3 n=1 Tax=Rhadinosa nigrocyanea TaxID=2093842 RepID=A0A343UQA5_9CUCU|nr:NADH dehydrogenase subunit 3 [Rhadinosa nigrocyanea]AVF96880.1 NADH dehydrogenase subunit 3 [Rhadinosa nigrocyanea]